MKILCVRFAVWCLAIVGATTAMTQGHRGKQARQQDPLAIHPIKDAVAVRALGRAKLTVRDAARWLAQGPKSLTIWVHIYKGLRSSCGAGAEA